MYGLEYSISQQNPMSWLRISLVRNCYSIFSLDEIFLMLGVQWCYHLCQILNSSGILHSLLCVVLLFLLTHKILTHKTWNKNKLTVFITYTFPTGFESSEFSRILASHNSQQIICRLSSSVQHFSCDYNYSNYSMYSIWHRASEEMLLG